MDAPFPLVYEGIEYASGVNLYVEPLYYSVPKWHVLFDFRTDLDPLHEFGAINGVLPGRSSEDAFNLRNLILRWSMPHCQCFWDNLPEAVEMFSEKAFSVRDLISTDQGDLTFQRSFSGNL